MAPESTLSWIRLAWAETRLQLRIFFRSVVAAFFTLALPLFFLVLLNLFLGGDTLESMGGISFAQFFTPGMAVFGMVTATFTNLAINTSLARDSGVLKRVFGSPMPLSAHLAGRIGAATLIGLLSVVVMVLVGTVLYGFELSPGRVPLLTFLMILGAACFAAVGLAVAMISPNSRAAPAVANAVILPLVFISGIFFPAAGTPGWLRTLSELLPLAPFAKAAVDLANPTLEPSVPWTAFVSLIVWGLVGSLAAWRLFSWEPRRDGGRARRAQSLAEMET